MSRFLSTVFTLFLLMQQATSDIYDYVGQHPQIINVLTADNLDPLPIIIANSAFGISIIQCKDDFCDTNYKDATNINTILVR